MRTRTRIAVVFGVLLLGAGGAMLFRKDAASGNGLSNSADAIPATQASENHPAADDQQVNKSVESAASRAAPATDARSSAAAPSARVTAPPSSPVANVGASAIAPSAQPAGSTADSAAAPPLWAVPNYPKTRTPHAPDWLADAAKADAPSDAAPANPTSTNWPADVPIATSESSRPRTHTIRDGDTLPLLALRYLDDADRQNEIYDLNRDLLPSPDLLPIGVTITLPKRAPPVARAVEPRSNVEEFQMVPVPPGALRGGQPATP